MQRIWLLDFAWPSATLAALTNPPSGSDAGVTLWRSLDGLQGRAYCQSSGNPGESWTPLEEVRSIEGPNHGEPPVCHYVVEADVAAEHEQDFNAWYEQEHLPGLAAVPGTIRAARYRRLSGSPRYLACYDLKSPSTTERPEWLAVRHTEWSSRIRPLFLNTRRSMFIGPQDITLL
jgi:hypothetical protein